MTNFSRDMPKKKKKKTGSSETESYDFDEIKSKKSLAEESQRQLLSHDHHANADVSKTISRATSEVQLYLEKRRKMFNVIKLAKNKAPLQKILEREHAIERTINLAHEYDE